MTSPAETASEYSGVTNPKASSTGNNTNLLNPGSPDPTPPPIGIFKNANNLGIDQIDFYVVASPVPEPASLSVLALGGLGLLARRRKNV